LRFRLTCVPVLLGAWLLLAGTPAFAGDAVAEEASAPSASEEAAPAPVHVTIGRALDLQGRQAWGVRSRDAEGGSEISISYSRPRVSLATGAILNGALPGGLPVASRALTSSFGMRVNPVTGIYAEHDGIDLAAPMGTPIIATGDGVIGSAGWRGGYGLMVAVEHGSGVETRYGHMSQIAVAPGEQVRKGEIIGYVGSTGRSTGPHVHYETRINGHPVNPLSR
jgi:murein DD-endopeptidase MepM/ murein hydrolase activator NlpD